MKSIRFLMLGDIVGAAGRAIFQRHIDKIRKEHAIDAVIVNGENSAHGVGITPKIADFFKSCGVNVITSGNHIWHKKEIFPYLAAHHDLLRPANYPSGAPGVGVTTFSINSATAAVINLQGQVFMRENIESPFRTAETILTYLRDKTKLIFIDFHAEATSEKIALGVFLDGKVTAVLGTHTHVQTADERILPNGTAYVTDVGMAGSINSLLGMESSPIIQRFLTQLPVKFTVAMNPPYRLDGVIVEADPMSGKALSIKRIEIIDNKDAAGQESVEEVGGW